MKRLAVLLLLPMLLAACGGSSKDKFPPPCPRAAILGDAADLERFRDGPGRDLTDLVVAGRILGISGACEPGETPDQLATTVRISFQLTRGPSMRGKQADVAIFLAVSEGDTILDKKIIPVRAAFPDNTDTIQLSTEAIPLSLAISRDKSGAAYAVTAGFQLTPDELARNRRHPTH